MNYFVPEPILVKGRHGMLRRGFSVADILKMIETGIINEDEKFELIEGEIIPVSPKHAPHEWIKYRLNREIVRVLPDEWLLAGETTVYLDDRTFVEPDLAIVPSLIDNTDLKPADIPLIIEIAYSTLRKDRDIKAPLYARYGFAEYWLIDARTRSTTVYRKPVDSRWTEIEQVASDQALTFGLFPGLSISFATMK